MDILRGISRRSANGELPNVSPSHVQIFQAASLPNSGLRVEINNIDEASLFDRIGSDQLFTKSSSSTPSLNMIFFPKEEWKRISNNKVSRAKVFNVFDYLRLDDALFAYLLSSRSGWYYVVSGERYSFMFKDYLYMLAWTFDPTTLETRAMLAARSDYEGRSNLKDNDGNFDLPGLRPIHLYHPLSLACFCLTDFVFYFDNLIVAEGYTIGNIENDTGHGLWVEEKTNTQAIELPNLMNASRDIARIIGIFANLFKGVEVSHTLVESLQDMETWREWYRSYHGDEEESMKMFDQCVTSFSSAIGLLKLRIKTIKQSGRVFDERAKAQSNVIAALIRREDARVGHQLADASKKLAEATKKDSSDMKVIAIMTMAFLPATFFAALFDIPTLAWDQPNVITQNFWVYWAFTLPTTLLVFVLWDILNERMIYHWTTGLACRIEKKEPYDSPDNRSTGLPWINTA
ncbi:hypothetical protein F5Y04DRAFT_265921 [Hypomontagnella monticulosa]|nr:hypothetical protein F5Y04DRAFT_265921 [Hypomontagnella monticulosa]